MPSESIYTISDLAEEFDVSCRTIRFYEEKGLLLPLRTSGNQRTYTKADRTRLKLILRGKKLGLKLDEMVEILGLSEAQSGEVEQMQAALKVGLGHLTNINHQIAELQSLKRELLQYGHMIVSQLKEKGVDASESEKILRQETVREIK